MMMMMIFCAKLQLLTVVRQNSPASTSFNMIASAHRRTC